MAHNYKTFMLSDEPKIAGIPVTTGLPVFLLTLIGMAIGYISQMFLAGSVISLVMYFKFGGLPIRVLLAMIYWAFPQTMTKVLFRAFPASSNRIYLR